MATHRAAEWVVFMQEGATPGSNGWMSELDAQINREPADIYGRLHWQQHGKGRMEYPHPGFFVARRKILENAPEGGRMWAVLGKIMRDRKATFARYEGAVRGPM